MTDGNCINHLYSILFIMQYPAAAANNLPPATTAIAIIPRSFSPEIIREWASHLLLMNMRWAKSVPAFTTLKYNDKNILLKESWLELFVLGAAELTLPIDVQLMMATPGLSSSLQREIKCFQEIVVKFKQMNVDHMEYAFIRSFLIFKPCKLFIIYRLYTEFNAIATKTYHLYI